MADLPRYQRALIESPDVAATNISALVEAQARTTEAVMTGLDKLVKYSIDIGEKKQKEQEKFDKLLALETGVEMNFEAQKEILNISNNIKTKSGYTPQMLEAEIAHASFIFKDLEKLDKETYLTFLEKFNNDAYKLRETLNNKLIEQNEIATLEKIKDYSTVAFNQLEDVLANKTFSDVDKLNAALDQRENFKTYLEISAPNELQAQMEIYDQQVSLLYTNTIINELIEQNTDKDTNIIDEGEIITMLDQNEVGGKLQAIWDQLSPEEKNTARENATSKISELRSIYENEEKDVVDKANQIKASLYAATDQKEREEIFSENRELLSILPTFETIENYVYEQDAVDTSTRLYGNTMRKFLSLASNGSLTLDIFYDEYEKIQKANPGFKLLKEDIKGLVDDISDPKEIINEQINLIRLTGYANESGEITNPTFTQTFNDSLQTHINRSILKFKKRTGKEEMTEPEVKAFGEEIQNELKAKMRPEFDKVINDKITGFSAYSEVYESFGIVTLSNLEKFIANFDTIQAQHLNTFGINDPKRNNAINDIRNLKLLVADVTNLIDARDR